MIIDANGKVTWNGTPVTSDEQLRQYLQADAADQPGAGTALPARSRTARYEKVDQVLAIIKRSEISKLGFIGNEQYRERLLTPSGIEFVEKGGRASGRPFSLALAWTGALDRDARRTRATLAGCSRVSVVGCLIANSRIPPIRSTLSESLRERVRETSNQRRGSESRAN